jgi:hypothetical protein
MAVDLTSDAPIRMLGAGFTEKFPMDTSSAWKFYKGQAVIFNSTDTSHLVPYVDGINVAATDVCLGVAAEGKSVVSGNPETEYLEVYVGPSIVGFPTSGGLVVADLGKTVYQAGSGELSLSVGDNAHIGKLVAVKDGYCYVELDTPVICVGA